MNLDDRCAVDDFIRDGIFLELGDVVVFAGRGNLVEADQYWDICEACYDLYPDEGILAFKDYGYFSLDTLPEYTIEYVWYEGVGIGQTRIDFCFNFGGLEVLENSFDVYVGVRPTLMAITSPRHTCDYCHSSW